MRSIDDFQAAVSARFKRMGIAIAIGIVVCIGGLGVLAAFRDYLFNQSEAMLGTAGAKVVMLGMVFIPVALFIAVLGFADYRSMRDPRLSCPHCGKRLLETRYISVATRNCGYCGRRVFDEPT